VLTESEGGRMWQKYYSIKLATSKAFCRAVGSPGATSKGGEWRRRRCRRPATMASCWIQAPPAAPQPAMHQIWAPSLRRGQRGQSCVWRIWGRWREADGLVLVAKAGFRLAAYKCADREWRGLEIGGILTLKGCLNLQTHWWAEMRAAEGTDHGGTRTLAAVHSHPHRRSSRWSCHRPLARHSCAAATAASSSPPPAAQLWDGGLPPSPKLRDDRAAFWHQGVITRVPAR
jgi:hypothetical protein